VENLKLTAILNFTRFIVTHVSIITSDISSNIYRYTFENLQNVLLPITSMSLQSYEEPLSNHIKIRGHFFILSYDHRVFFFSNPHSHTFSAYDRDFKCRRFGNLLEPRYIFGAIELDQWAITLSSKDGCFQAHLLVVWALSHPFPLSKCLRTLAYDLGFFPFDFGP